MLRIAFLDGWRRISGMAIFPQTNLLLQNGKKAKSYDFFCPRVPPTSFNKYQLTFAIFPFDSKITSVEEIDKTSKKDFFISPKKPVV